MLKSYIIKDKHGGVTLKAGAGQTKTTWQIAFMTVNKRECQKGAPGSHDRANPGTTPSGDSSDPRGSDTTGAGKSSDPRRDLQNAEQGGGGLYNAGGDGAGGSLSPSGLGAAEAAGGLYNPADVGGLRSKLMRPKFKFSRRKKAGYGIVGALVAGAIGFATISSGPLEFIHIAQLLEKFHFSNMQNTQDNRLTKLARYIRDPSKPQNTRLGILGNAVADKLETRMNESGFKSQYTDKLGYHDGYIVDPENKNFKDKNTAQIRDELVKNYGIEPGAIEPGVSSDGKQTIKINTDKMGFLAKRKLAKNILKNTHMNKLSAALGARVMGRRAGITWHPIRKLDQKVLQALADRSPGNKAKEKLKELKDQFRKDQVTYANKGASAVKVEAKDGTPKDKNGNPIDPNGSQSAADLSNQVADNNTQADQAATDTANGDPNGTNKLTDHLGGKVAGGGVALVGVACMIKGLSANIGSIPMAQVVLPMMRIGMQAVTLGGQVMSGQDLTAVQLGFFKDQLDKTDKNGKTISTWNQAKSIQYEQGQTQNGPDIPKGAKVLGKGNPFDFLDGVSGLDPVCSALGSDVGQVAGFALNLLGGPVSAVANVALGEALKPVLNDAAHYFAGAAIDPFAAGADRGNFMNYGVRLASNDQAVAAGGSSMSPAAESQAKLVDASVDQASFKSESLAYQLFNPYDSRTLASHFIDQQNPDVSQNFARMATGFSSIFTTALTIPSTLFSSVAHAKPASTYDYGFPKYGFSVSDENSPKVKNPFDNATKAAAILDSDHASGDTLINRANKCFGVTLTNDGKVWDVNGGNSSTNLYDDSYKQNNCDDTSSDWMRIRFFVLDTETMKGGACYFGDEQSCTDSGFGSSSGTGGSSSSSSSGNSPSGTAKDLATQLLPFIANGKIKCGPAAGGTESADCSDIQNTAKGQPIGGNCVATSLTPHLLGLILGLVRDDGWTLGISAICSDHHSEKDGPYGGHSNGSVADFSSENGASGAAAAANEKFVNDAAALLSATGGSFGQVTPQCHAPYAVLSNPKFTTFPDSCNHQHIRAAD